MSGISGSQENGFFRGYINSLWSKIIVTLVFPSVDKKLGLKREETLNVYKDYSGLNSSKN